MLAKKQVNHKKSEGFFFCSQLLDTVLSKGVDRLGSVAATTVWLKGLISNYRISTETRNNIVLD